MTNLETLKQWIRESSRIVFFGGAGVSTESGIPDFRSVDGLYHQKFDYPPETIISHSFYERQPEYFFRFYREKMLPLGFEPNVTHRVLARWEQEGRLYGPDPMFVYPGDPHDHTGYGCYAPCIVQALQSALKHEGAADRFEVLDVSGETAAQLCRFIDEGIPVVFWATLDFTPVPEERDHWLLADGTDFAWKCHEHCLLLVGYDEENYWFNDPWHDHGVCAQPKELVERCHAAQDSYAVTLRRK